MIISLDEMKGYLRVDYDEDDSLIENLIESSTKLCIDISRVESEEELEKEPNSKTAVMYACAYMYEHREEADYNDMLLTLRAILFGIRKDRF